MKMRRMGLRFIALLTATVLTCGSLTSASVAGPTPFPREGLLVFSDYGYLSTIAPDGSGLRDLVRVSRAYEPRWSPDGRLIAYSRHARSQEIWLSRSDGTGRNRLTRPPTGATDSSPAWSPRGERLVYRRLLGLGARVVA
jgi:dipeptidyl aminopeptidase/acylaminoacyl peptidase